MVHYFAGVLTGAVAMGVVAFAYHKVIVAEYGKAASTIGIVFNKVEGKITAFRKG